MGGDTIAKDAKVSGDAGDTGDAWDADGKARSPGAHAAKVRENRVRRAAERQGIVIHKSARRDPYATDYNKYAMTSSVTGQTIGQATISLPSATVVSNTLTIDQVEHYLTEGRDIWQIAEAQAAPKPKT